MLYSKIKKVSSYLPTETLSNAQIEKIVDTSDEWIQKRTGIKKRHIAHTSESVLDMAFKCTQNLNENVDAIIVATYSNEHRMPSLACKLAHKLGIDSAAAFDINAACTGFLYALTIADQFIKNNTFKRILIVGADKNTNFIDWTDRTTCLLFGDAAGCFILEKSEKPGVFLSEIGSYNQYSDLLKIQRKGIDDEFIEMSGKHVFKIAVQTGVDLIKKIQDKHTFDWIIMHQANIRIIQAIAEQTNFSYDRCIVTIQDHANTSAASIPLAFDQAIKDKKIKSGDRVYCLAFGAGFTWSHTLFEF
tara:strand:- start:4487 stop:5395 length:909 start_codon:yes stop_codon:yes gene_type:complete